MNISPIIAEAARRYILSGKFRRDDFQFTVEKDGLFWDIYKVRGHEQDGQMALSLKDGTALIGWFGPGNHSKEEIVKYIGLNWEIPDA